MPPPRYIFYYLTRPFNLFAMVLAAVIVTDLFIACQRVKKQAQKSCIICDARQLGSAAQQFMLSTKTTSVSFTYDPKTGNLTGDIIPWIKQISKNLLIPDTTITSGETKAFAIGFIENPEEGLHWFNDEGKLSEAPPAMEPNPGIILGTLKLIHKAYRSIFS